MFFKAENGSPPIKAGLFLTEEDAGADCGAGTAPACAGTDGGTVPAATGCDCTGVTGPRSIVVGSCSGVFDTGASPSLR